MSIKRIRKLNILNYIRELSIVIVGVAVTLYTGNIVNNIKEKKDLNLQLNAIYLELEDNLQRVQELSEYYKTTEKFRHFLHEEFNDPEQKELNDSIQKYTYIIGKINPFIYKKGAFEMFMSSGAMKSLSNKKLLLDITEVYAMLETIKEDYDRYSALKIQEIQKFFDLDTELVFDNINIKDPRFRSMYNFYMTVSRGFYSKEAETYIEKILSDK